MLTGGRCAVVGHPVAHSLSPVMHREAYARLGLHLTYDAVDVEPGGLGVFVRTLDASWRGLSVTAPHKRDALDLADSADDVARRVGAANTIVLGGDGRHAHNTDVPGAVAALRERGIESVRTVRILGGGATAASFTAVAAELRAEHVELVVRDVARAAEARAVGERHEMTVATSSLDGVSGSVSGREVDLLVSTVPADAVRADVAALVAAAGAVFDVVYDPWPTPLAAAAAERTPLVTGLDLLAHQAVLQVGLMTGSRVEADVLRTAARDELARRSALA